MIILHVYLGWLSSLLIFLALLNCVRSDTKLCRTDISGDDCYMPNSNNTKTASTSNDDIGPATSSDDNIMASTSDDNEEKAFASDDSEFWESEDDGGILRSDDNRVAHPSYNNKTADLRKLYGGGITSYRDILFRERKVVAAQIAHVAEQYISGGKAGPDRFDENLDKLELDDVDDIEEDSYCEVVKDNGDIIEKITSNCEIDIDSADEEEMLTSAETCDLKPDERKICYALALSGGGNKGSYQAGVLQGLVDQHLEAKRPLHWDVVAGVSVGALNGFTSRYFAPGDEKNWADALTNIWRYEIFQSSVSDCSMPLSSNILTFLYRVLRHLLSGGPFIMASVPMSLCRHENSLSALFDKLFTSAVAYPERGLIISAARINDARYISFTDQRNTTDIVRAVLGSVAVPFLFPPVEVDKGSGEYYYDGGMIDNTNVSAAAKRCKDKFNITDNSQIIVDVIDCSNNEPLNNLDFNSKNGPSFLHSFVSVLYRVLAIVRRPAKGIQSVLRAVARYPGIRIRHYVQPTAKSVVTINNESMINVSDRTMIDKFLKLGYSDGKNNPCGIIPVDLDDKRRLKAVT